MFPPISYGTGNDAPLDVCCIEARHQHIATLLGNDIAVHGDLAPMLYDLVLQRVPHRIFEINQTLFGVFRTKEPFWGVYDHLNCALCHRELHVLAIDELMIEALDLVTRNLFLLLDESQADELTFKSASPSHRRAAIESLSALVFFHKPEIHQCAVRRELPYAFLTEAMIIGLVFMIVHETSHQGPQDHGYNPDYLVPTAIALAAEGGISLSGASARAWAKELAADLNAYIIMETSHFLMNNNDLFKMRQSAHKGQPRDEILLANVRVAGIALALKVWDLLLFEISFGNEVLRRELTTSHPPANLRLEHLSKSVSTLSRLGAAHGSMEWANKLLFVLDDLYQSTR